MMVDLLNGPEQLQQTGRLVQGIAPPHWVDDLVELAQVSNPSEVGLGVGPVGALGAESPGSAGANPLPCGLAEPAASSWGATFGKAKNRLGARSRRNVPAPACYRARPTDEWPGRRANDPRPGHHPFIRQER
jgi:hypothetical protein